MQFRQPRWTKTPLFDATNPMSSSVGPNAYTCIFIVNARTLSLCLSLTHHDELRWKEERVGLAVDRLRPEVEVLHWAGEPLVLGQEAREVEGEDTREEKRADKSLPCLPRSKRRTAVLQNAQQSMNRLFITLHQRQEKKKKRRRGSIGKRPTTKYASLLLWQLSSMRVVCVSELFLTFGFWDGTYASVAKYLVYRSIFVF